jgi:hypothetical protein
MVHPFTANEDLETQSWLFNNYTVFGVQEMPLLKLGHQTVNSMALGGDDTFLNTLPYLSEHWLSQRPSFFYCFHIHQSKVANIYCYKYGSKVCRKFLSSGPPKGHLPWFSYP